MGARVFLAVVPVVAAVLVRIMGATLRVRVSGEEEVVALWRAGRPVIYVMWHGRILLVPWLIWFSWRRQLPEPSSPISKRRRAPQHRS